MADAEDSFVSAQSEISHNSNSTSGTTKAPNGGNNNNDENRSRNRKSQNLSPEEQEAQHIREILINLKCLSIAHAMLQNISGPIITNMNLEGMLDSLILPSVRSHDAPVRLKALACLGLCCIIEPKLAVMNWSVFEHCLKRGDDAIKILSLQVFCDVLMAMQGRITLPPPSSSSSSSVAENNNNNNNTTTTDNEDEAAKIRFDIDPFIYAFEFTSSPEVQNVATTSLGKLMLCGFYRGDFARSFDDAVEEAARVGAKGHELLSKVRMAMQTDRAVAGDAVVGGGGGNDKGDGGGKRSSSGHGHGNGNGNTDG